MGELPGGYVFSVTSWDFYNKLADIYNQYFADENTSQDISIILGIDLGNVSLNSQAQATRVDAPFKDVLYGADVIFDLSQGFWANLGEIVENPSIATGFQLSSVSSPSESGVIDLGRVAIQNPNYYDFARAIRTAFSVTLATDSPAQEYEFSTAIAGSLQFKHESSGRILNIALTDLDSSWHLPGSSGLGAIDSISDDFGNPISTEFEFGMTGPWQLQELLTAAEEAYKSDWSSGVTTVDDSNGLSRWTLTNGHIMNHGTNALSGPVSNLSSFLQNWIDSESFSFYTRPLSLSLPDQSPEPLQFEINDFQNTTIDVSEGIYGFDIDLNAPQSSSLDAVPFYKSYSGQIVFTPNFDTSVMPALYGEVGDIRINFGGELDGFLQSHQTFSRSGNQDLADLYPELATSNPSLEYRLSQVILNANLFETANPGEGNYSVTFNIREDGLVDRIQPWSDSYQTLSQLFPNWELLQSVTVAGLFDEANPLIPLSAKLSLLEDQPWGSEQSAIGFRYGLRSAGSSDSLSQLAVLGDSVDESQSYYLDIYGTSLLEGFDINTLDFTVALDTTLFKETLENPSLPRDNGAVIAGQD